jgi:DNA-binding response OmpR family regulator
VTGPGERPKHILLVDDDPLVVKVYAERMRYEGWIVAVGRDGWEACQEADRSRFDMILLDIRMPFHNGVEVLQQIRAGSVNRTTPVYILTGLTEGEAVDEALRLGADGVFFKSSTRPDELVKKVAAILASSPKQRLLSEKVAVAQGAEQAAPAEQATSVEPAVPEAEPAVAEAEAEPAEMSEDSSVIAREHGLGKTPAAVPDDFIGAVTEIEYETGPEAEEAAEVVELDPIPEPSPTAAAPIDLRDLERDFDVYVNPFLGSGALLSKALGLPEIYQCGDCGGQVSLRLTRDPRLEGKAVVGYFVCSRCGVAV